MTQKTVPAKRTTEEEDVTAPAAETAEEAEARAKRDADLDNLLDEIDTVIEPNAEEFVRAYVQKGGE